MDLYLGHYFWFMMAQYYLQSDTIPESGEATEEATEETTEGVFFVPEMDEIN
jgi:hypothetical protein